MALNQRYWMKRAGALGPPVFAKKYPVSLNFYRLKDNTRAHGRTQGDLPVWAICGDGRGTCLGVPEALFKWKLGEKVWIVFRKLLLCRDRVVLTRVTIGRLTRQMGLWPEVSRATVVRALATLTDLGILEEPFAGRSSWLPVAKDDGTPVRLPSGQQLYLRQRLVQGGIFRVEGESLVCLPREVVRALLAARAWHAYRKPRVKGKRGSNDPSLPGTKVEPKYGKTPPAQVLDFPRAGFQPKSKAEPEEVVLLSQYFSSSKEEEKGSVSRRSSVSSFEVPKRETPSPSLLVPDTAVPPPSGPEDSPRRPGSAVTGELPEYVDRVDYAARLLEALELFDGREVPERTLPPSPAVGSTVPMVVTPEPPKLSETQTPEERADALVRAYRMVYERRAREKGVSWKPCFVGRGRQRDVSRSKAYKLLSAGSAMLLEHGIAPLYWVIYRFDMWGYQLGEGATTVAPTLGWIFNAKAMLENWDTCKHSAQPLRQFRSVPKHRDLYTRWRHLKSTIDYAQRQFPDGLPSRVVSVLVEAAFPGDAWEKAVAEINAETEQTQLELRWTMTRGEWIWD